MDVTADTFPHDLLGLLIHISEADFVSFDLELSGIPNRMPDNKPRSARPTLDDRYAETKQGADRYQILQVGLTCAKFDYLTNKYSLRPYNINISPLLDERLDFEREITFQSGACSFLLGCQFDLGAPFATGVQYLSREEAERAKKLAYDRIDKKNVIEDLQLRDTDTDSLDFVRRCRHAIATWQKSTAATLEITTSTGLPNAAASYTISRFEKRLVHQLVRAEFPDAVAVGRNDCIRILPFDPVREADNTRRIKTRVKDQIARQTGFRWIFEALVGGDINNDLLYLLRTNGPSDLRDVLDRALARLKKNRPVLVGHNMFTDVVYLYRTFVGPLPDTLDAFTTSLHTLCPRIVDTKYLATHDGGDLNASPTLEDIAKGLQKQRLPNMATHEDHAKYNELEAFHEAGYDSLLTATIMLRLAAKLGAEREEREEHEERDKKRSDSREQPAAAKPVLGREASEGGISLIPLPTTGRAKRKTKRKTNAQPAPNAQPNPPRFATKTLFDSLAELSVDGEDAATSEDDAQLDHDALADGTRVGDAQLHHERLDDGTHVIGSWADEEFLQDETGWVPIPPVRRARMEKIPDFAAPFWAEFGNRLRVFGTEEREWRIAAWA